jgi:excisionase family DNA binding protein
MIGTPENRFIPLHELSTLIGLQRTTIYELIKKGQLQPIKVGRRTLFSKLHILAWMKVKEFQSGIPALGGGV